jgi:hypothetical protein
MDSIEDNIEIEEFLEQINYALSTKFKEKWKHRFSAHFIEVFQDRILKGLKDGKPIKKSALESLYQKKHKYSLYDVKEFFRLIDLTLYYPFIYND